MRRTLGSPLALVAAALVFYTSGVRAQAYADAGPLQFTAEELENLLAPVALYPDPILAQVLVAASYPDEVDLAARHVRVYGSSRIDDQPWDLSVKAVAHYEPVLNLMADRLDWTTALGQAYAEQPDDVMAAVQSLRAMARAQGNLVTTDHHEVVVDDHHYIRIVPAHPRVVYVPVYDPLVIYHRPIVHLGVYSRGWSFGIGFPIGAWLAYDFDWHRRHVFYHGWDPYAYRFGWIARSRPFVVINHIYVQPRPRVVVVNRRAINRYVDYRRFDRYNSVHRQVAWERHDRQARRRYADGARSWVSDDDRDDRPSRNPSWDRTGRFRANDEGRQPVQRSSVTTRSSLSGAQRAAPQSQPRPSEARQAQPRARTRQVDAQPEARSQTRSAVPQHARSQSQPQRAQSQRAQPQRAQPQRSRSSRAEARPQPSSRSEVRVQRSSSRPEARVQRSSSRAEVQRSQARALPSRAQRSESRSISAERSGRSASKARSSGRRRGSD